MKSLAWARHGRVTCVFALFASALIGCGSSSSKGSGSDAGMQDGSTADAGMQDAAVQDGGNMDAAVQDGSTADAGGPPTLADFCQQLSDDVCTYFAGCPQSPALPSSCPTGPDSPVTLLQNQCPGLTNLVNAGQLTFDANAARQCLDSFDYTNCSAPPDALDGIGACSDVFTGTVANGSDCYWDLSGGVLNVNECASGYCSMDTCPGTCTAYAPVNGSCAGIGCDPNTAWCNNGTCEQFLTENADCGTGGVCGPGLVCASVGGSQTCLPTVPQGGTCVANEQCGGGVCTGGRCVVNAQLGEPCNNPSNCPVGDSCALAPPGDAGTAGDAGAAGDAGEPTPTCQVPGGLNDYCGGGLNCGAGLYCNSSLMCAEPGTAGQSCESDSQCATGYWCAQETNGNICRALGAQGDDCSDKVLGPYQQRCQGDLVCVPSGLDASTGKPNGWQCEPLPSQGSLCNGYNTYQPACVSGFYCSGASFTCVQVGNVGETCEPNKTSCASGLFCQCGASSCACAQPLAPGASCTPVDQCASGYSCDFFVTNKCIPGDCTPP